MPCEVIKVALKPVNFFEKNPALDVPPSTQDFNQSVLLGNEEKADVDACCISSGSGKSTTATTATTSKL